MLVDMSPDPVCGKVRATPLYTQHYLVAKDGGLANVFVYIRDGLRGRTFPPPANTPLLDQVGCVFTPYVMGVRTNQVFKIRNSDPTLHNVHATPKTNEEFNLAQPVKDLVSLRQFNRPEVLVRIKCDVHPWMFAFVGVVEHPAFDVSAKDGSFKITGVPPGKYTLAAVHPKAGVLAQEVTITEKENAPVNFTFVAKPPK